MKQVRLGLTGLVLCLLAGCGTEAYSPPDYSKHDDPNEEMYVTELVDAKKLEEGTPLLVRQEGAAFVPPMTGPLIFNENIYYDLRYRDVTAEDLSIIGDVNEFSFNTSTVWPADLPEGFDPAGILERNKNPGLGVRALHSRGITGEGVGIAVIDQALFTGHEQYRDNLMLYELLHCSDPEAQMHGAAVASLAVGKDTGVAPGAKLYFIASTFGHWTENEFVFDASVIADGILRVLELNRHLPEGEKIRVISISKGYKEEDPGYEQLTKAIRKADEAGVFVLTTSTAEYYDFDLFGMGRDELGDPDDIRSYLPISWVSDHFYTHPDSYRDTYLVPMGSLTYAGFTGERNYEINPQGGMSWAVPWCAGFYALCCQAKPDLTPTEFIAAVKTAAVTTEIEHNGQVYTFGNIVDPAGTIAVLQGK